MPSSHMKWQLGKKKKSKPPIKKKEENPLRTCTNVHLKNKAEQSLCNAQSKARGGHIKLIGTKLKGLEGI